jgi:hypothetical protein
MSNTKFDRLILLDVKINLNAQPYSRIIFTLWVQLKFKLLDTSSSHFSRPICFNYFGQSVSLDVQDHIFLWKQEMS